MSERMNKTMKITILEGTPEELLEYQKNLLNLFEKNREENHKHNEELSKINRWITLEKIRININGLSTYEPYTKIYIKITMRGQEHRIISFENEEDRDAALRRLDLYTVGDR